jgi:iron complex outermembrane receptor protein
MLVVGLNNTFAQDKITVNGTVIDENSQALIGVNVSAESQASGTVTDIEGHFSLNVAKGETLIFSYIGYNTLKIPAQPLMEVQMDVNTVTLDAITVVGIGYGTARKSDLTGSISSVSADNLKKGVITSTEQLLQGKIAGLVVLQPSGDPTQGSSLRLRGGTSLSASNSPLIVVDGIPGVDLNTIQPNEIVSIDVLKDASAAAIFGSRGANGVIIVTTKREKAGKQMNYTGYVAVGNAAKNLDLFSADQWRTYMRENNVAGAVDYGGNTDWQDEIQQTAISHNHTLSFINSGEQNGFRVSLGYQNTEGVIKTSALNRLSGSLSGYQYGLNNRLKLETGIHANTDNYHPVDIGIYERAYNLNPTLPVTQNGKYTQIGGTNNNNPVEILDHREDDQSRTRLLAYTKAELDIIDGLKGVVNASYEYNTQQGRYFQSVDYFMDMTSKGYGRRSLADYTNWQMETYLTYSKTLNNIHKLNLLAGYSYLKNQYEGFGAERRGFEGDRFTYNNLAAGTDFRTGDVYSYKGQSQLISFFGRVNYSLMDKYLLTGTLRRDGSSRFGKNKRWGVFPSVSAAWRISEEAFMENTKSWLDNLKLRIGYGITGNQDGIGEYKSKSLMGIIGEGAYYDQQSDTWKQSYGPTQNANPDLQWESTAQTNIGVDVTFLNRFNLTLDAYIKKTSNLLYTYYVPQPPNLYPTTMANVGDLSNKGIEATLATNIIRTKDFEWNANLTLAYNKQTLDRLSNQFYQTDAVQTGNLHGMTGLSNFYTQTLREGYPVGTFWGPRCLGIDEDGKFILETDENGDPIIGDLGSAQPKLSLGLALDFTYRDFDLNIAAYGMFGQKVLNAQAMNISYPGRLPAYNVLDAWPGKNITEGPIYSDYWIENGDFLRIQGVTLGYTLPVKNAWFGKIRLYATGENLFVFTHYSGLDPEVNISGLKSPGIDKSVGSSDNGDNYYYPRPRIFSFGINLIF